MQLVLENRDYKLLGHFDTDLYDMPRDAVIQITKPVTLIRVAKLKGFPKIL